MEISLLVSNKPQDEEEGDEQEEEPEAASSSNNNTATTADHKNDKHQHNDGPHQRYNHRKPPSASSPSPSSSFWRSAMFSNGGGAKVAPMVATKAATATKSYAKPTQSSAAKRKTKSVAAERGSSLSLGGTTTQQKTNETVTKTSSTRQPASSSNRNNPLQKGRRREASASSTAKTLKVPNTSSEATSNTTAMAVAVVGTTTTPTTTLTNNQSRTASTTEKQPQTQHQPALSARRGSPAAKTPQQASTKTSTTRITNTTPTTASATSKSSLTPVLQATATALPRETNESPAKSESHQREDTPKKSNTHAQSSTVPISAPSMPTTSATAVSRQRDGQLTSSSTTDKAANMSPLVDATTTDEPSQHHNGEEGNWAEAFDHYDDTSTLASSVQEIYTSEKKQKQSPRATTPQPMHQQSTSPSSNSKAPPPRVSVIGSPQDFLPRGARRPSRSSLGGRGGRWLGQTKSPTVARHSVSGVSVFDRLYHDAKVRDAKQRAARAEKDAEESSRNYRFRPASTGGKPRQRSSRGGVGGRRSTGWTTPSIAEEGGGGDQDHNHGQQQQKRYLSHHPNDADSTMSSLHSPSLSTARTPASTRRSGSAGMPYFYHNRDVQSVTSEDRRRFFSSSARRGRGSIGGGDEDEEDSVFERLYENDYSCSASKHKHTSHCLSAESSLSRRVNYRPSPIQLRHPIFFRSPNHPPPKSILCSSPLDMDEYFFTVLEPQTRRLSASENTAALRIQQHWRNARQARIRRGQELAATLIAVAWRGYKAKQQPQSPVALLSSSSSSSATSPGSPQHRAVVEEFAKWKQLQKAWFVHQPISSSSSSSPHETKEPNKGSTAHLHSPAHSSRLSPPSPPRVELRSPPASETNNVVVVDSSRELAWQELQSDWRAVVEGEDSGDGKTHHLSSSPSPFSLQPRPRRPLQDPLQDVVVAAAAALQVNGVKKEEKNQNEIEIDEELETAEPVYNSTAQIRCDEDPAGSSPSHAPRMSPPAATLSPLEQTASSPSQPHPLSAYELLALLKLQSVMRMRHSRQSFRSLRRSIKRLQGLYRTKRRQTRDLQQSQRENEEAGPQESDRRMNREMETEQRTRAVLCFQALVRGFLARILSRQLRVEHQKAQHETTASSTLAVQSAMRRCLARKHLVRLELEREELARQELAEQESTGLSVASASLLIQSLARGSKARTLFAQLQEQQQRLEQERSEQIEQADLATTRIQSFLRASCARQSYRRKRASALLLQSRARSNFAQERYSMERAQVVCLQNFVRWSLARKQLLALRGVHEAANKEQERQERDAMNRISALRIQQWFRGHQMQLEAVSALAQSRVAATIIQSWWRCYMARCTFVGGKAAAILLQSVIRSRREMATFRHIIRAITLIQSHIRGLILKHEFSIQRHAAVCLQTVWRKAVDRRNRNQRIAVFRVQSAWRSWEAQRSYRHTRAAVLTLQLMALDFLERRQTTKAAIRLQSSWRSAVAHSRYQRQWVATMILQRTARDFLSRKAELARALMEQEQLKQLTELQNFAATLIQSRWLSSTEHAQFRSQRTSAIVLQAFARGFFARQTWVELLLQQERQQHERVLQSAASAARIQSYWRCVSMVARYRQQRASGVVLQSAVRGYLARSAFQQKRQSLEHEKHTAAVAIQSKWRSGRACSAMRQQRAGLILIQSAFRRFLSFSHVQSLRLEKTNQQQHNAVCIQTAARGFLANRRFDRMCEQDHVQKSCAAGRLQSQWRAANARAQFRLARSSAIAVEAAFRGFLERRHLEQERQRCNDAYSRLQAWWRTQISQSWYRQQQVAAIVLESSFRGFLARQTVRRLHQMHLAAAMRIQTSWRRSIQQNRYHRYRDGALVLETFSRGCLARRERSHLREHQFQQEKRSQTAATLLQSLWRGAVGRRNFTQHLGQQNAATKLAAVTRRFLAEQTYARIQQEQQQKAEQQRIAIAAAATSLQAQARGFLAQRTFQQKQLSVVVLEAMVRGFMARKLFLRKRREDGAAQVIQCFARTNSCRSRFLEQRNMAIVLQTAARGHLIRSRFKADMLVREQADAATTIQSYQRRCWARLGYLRTLSSTVLLQSWARCFLSKKTFEMQRDAVIVIQSVIRLRLDRARFLSLHTETMATRRNFATIRIQTWLRSRMALNNFHRQHHAIVQVQAYFRMHLCCSRFVELLQQHREDPEERHAATLIQKVVRGSSQRTKLWQQQEAALKISHVYILWKTRELLRKFQCGTVLLRRGVGGDSTFALQQVADCLHSRFGFARASFSSSSADHANNRGLTSDVAVRMGSLWGLASSQVKECAVVILQRRLRGYRARREFERKRNASCVIQRAVRGVWTYREGLLLLKQYFEQARKEEQRERERRMAQDWFLSRLEMRSETTAQELLVQVDNDHRACLQQLAERARVARAQALSPRGATSSLSSSPKSSLNDDGKAGPHRDNNGDSSDSNSHHHRGLFLGVENLLSPIEKRQ